MGERFDWDAFRAALDAFRVATDLTWAEVSRQTGVPASSLSRFANGKELYLDAVLALLLWAGLRMDEYIRYEGQRPSGLAHAVTALYRDDSLTPAQRKALSTVLVTAYCQLRSDPPRADEA